VLTPILGSDSGILSLPPPPRPRNRALIRPAPHPPTPLPYANSNLSRLPHSSASIDFTAPTIPLLHQQTAEQAFIATPTLAPAPHTREFSVRQSSLHCSLHSLPLTPAAIPLPPSSAVKGFPQSPRSSNPSTPHTSSPPSPRSPYRTSFLPSCKSTIDTLKDECGTPRRSECTERNRSSGFSIPFNDFNFPRCYQRASGISFTSSVSGFSARSATEAECIPISLHDASARPTQLDFGLAPLSPRSSLLRDAGVEVDVQLPPVECEDGTDTESCVTEDSKHEPKSPKEGIGAAFRGRARSLSAALPHLNISSLNKVSLVHRAMNRQAHVRRSIGFLARAPHVPSYLEPPSTFPNFHSPPCLQNRQMRNPRPHWRDRTLSRWSVGQLSTSSRFRPRLCHRARFTAVSGAS
jgi:hypothetical protein